MYVWVVGRRGEGNGGFEMEHVLMNELAFFILLFAIARAEDLYSKSDVPDFERASINQWAIG